MNKTVSVELTAAQIKALLLVCEPPDIDLILSGGRFERINAKAFNNAVAELKRAWKKAEA